MSNARALRQGSQIARDMIFNHTQSLLKRALHELVFEATAARENHNNMTGNTINSYCGAVYYKGNLLWIETTQGFIRLPLRKKLTIGIKPKRTTAFFSGETRWDGGTQWYTFMAPVQTNSTMENDRGIKFLKTYQATSKGWAMVICNGVEYAEFQESAMNIDVLTGNFNYAKMFMPTMFHPLPD